MIVPMNIKIINNRTGSYPLNFCIEITQKIDALILIDFNIYELQL